MRKRLETVNCQSKTNKVSFIESVASCQTRNTFSDLLIEIGVSCQTYQNKSKSDGCFNLNCELKHKALLLTYLNTAAASVSGKLSNRTLVTKNVYQTM